MHLTRTRINGEIVRNKKMHQLITSYSGIQTTNNFNKVGHQNNLVF